MPATPSSRSQLLARAEMLLPPRRAESTIPGRSDSLEETLLVVLNQDLGQLALFDDAVRRLMTTNVAFTLDAQSQIALSAAQFDTIDLQAIDSAELYIAGFRGKASYHRDFFTFDTGTPKPGVARWIVTESKLLVRAATSSATALKACTLRDALIVPTVLEATPASNTLHPDLEERVVAMVVAKHLAALAAGAGAQAGQGAAP